MLYLSAVILALFLSFLLVTKRNKSAADLILAAWMAFTGYHLFAFYMYFNDQALNYPSLIASGFPLPLLQGPFLYLYTRQQTSSTPFRKSYLLHFLPVVASYAMFAGFFFMSFEERSRVFAEKGRGYEIHTFINQIAIYISGVVYIVISLRRLLRYRRKLVHLFSNTERINFNWLLYLIIWVAIIWTVVLFVQKDYLIFGAASLFIIWLGYFGIKQVQVFGQGASLKSTDPESLKQNEKEVLDLAAESGDESDDFVEDSNQKYQKSSLSEQDVNQIHERLINLLRDEKPYTNPDLTLNELARSLSVHPNHLSQVINSKEKRNFYDLINEWRVNEFISNVSQSSNRQFTLLAIAFDSGFNSKASFNRNFKKYTGLTPSDYIKSKPELKVES